MNLLEDLDLKVFQAEALMLQLCSPNQWHFYEDAEGRPKAMPQTCLGSKKMWRCVCFTWRANKKLGKNSGNNQTWDLHRFSMFWWIWFEISTLVAIYQGGKHEASAWSLRSHQSDAWTTSWVGVLLTYGWQNVHKWSESLGSVFVLKSSSRIWFAGTSGLKIRRMPEVSGKRTATALVSGLIPMLSICSSIAPRCLIGKLWLRWALPSIFWSLPDEYSWIFLRVWAPKAKTEIVLFAFFLGCHHVSTSCNAVCHALPKTPPFAQKLKLNLGALKSQVPGEHGQVARPAFATYDQSHLSADWTLPSSLA